MRTNGRELGVFIRGEVWYNISHMPRKRQVLSRRW